MMRDPTSVKEVNGVRVCVPARSSVCVCIMCGQAMFMHALLFFFFVLPPLSLSFLAHAVALFSC